MNKLEEKYLYNAFGLHITSEISLPELTLEENNKLEKKTDVVIRKYDLSLNFPAYHENRIVVENDLFMFKIPNVAIYVIQGGKEIVVSPFHGADPDEVRLYILGTCIGALLTQKRIITLHGSAVVVGNSAYAFIGDQGAGKSTLATGFLNRGSRLLTDDVIPVKIIGNVPYVIPSYPQQKLWDNSMIQFGMNLDKYSPLFGRESKYKIPVPSSFYSKPLPLSKIFEVRKTDCKEVKLRSLNKLQGLHTLYTHTYRNFLIRRLGLTEWHFNQSTQILNHASIYQLVRPQTTFTANELVKRVLETTEGGSPLDSSYQIR